MGRLARLHLALASLLVVAHPASGETLEHVARFVFDSLQGNRLQSLERLVPTVKDVRWNLDAIEQRFGKAAATAARARIEEQGGAELAVASARKKAAKANLKAYQDSARTFDWAEAKFDGWESEHSTALPGDGLVRLVIRVRAGGARYRFSLDDFLAVEHGWASTSGVKFQGLSGCLERLTFARQAFRALQSGDYGQLEAILPTAEDLTWAFEEMARNGNPEPAKSVRAIGGVAGPLREMSRENKKEFDRSLAKAKGVFDWRKARFAGIDKGRTRTRTEDGIVSGDIYFQVVADSVRYVVKLNECARLRRGWVCTDGVRLLGPAK